MSALLEAIRNYTEGIVMQPGMTSTAIPGVFVVRAEEPSGLTHEIYKPLICLILQGSKMVTMGNRAFHFAAGDSLIVTSEVPTVSQVTEASVKKPYLAIVLEMEASIVTELSPLIQATTDGARTIVQVDPTERDVTDTVLRIVRLLERPEHVAVLLPNYMRELHYWLLMGKHGYAARRYAAPNGTGKGIGRALTIIRKRFAEHLSVRDLANAAGMSPSAFHEHFREATASTPLQYQKQLRLIEAKRLMLSEGWSASSAAFEVGYESVNQFTREYRRMFGAPPAMDIKAARTVLASALAPALA